VDTEEKQKKTFMKRLHPYMKMQLKLTRTTEFQEFVDAAITLEDDYKTVQQERKKKLQMEPKKYPFKKANPNLNPNSDLTFKLRPRPGFQNSGRGGSNPRSQVICHNYGYKGHYASECQQPKVICYGCGKLGLMKPNCPNQSNNIPPAGGNRPPNAPIASQGRNFGRNDAGRKGKPIGKLNCTNVKEVIHLDEAVIGKYNEVANALS
jgi:hypothetical protein